MTFQRRICPFSGRISTLSSVGIPDLQNPKIADRSYAHHSRGKLERREGEFVNGTYPSVIFKDGAGKEDQALRSMGDGRPAGSSSLWTCRVFFLTIVRVLSAEI